MALTNHQYEEIMRAYEETRDRNRRLAEERRARVLQKLPSYAELDAQIAALSMDAARRMLADEAADHTARAELHDRIAEISSRKRKLLVGAGFAPDYLEPIYTCPDCRDTGYIDTPGQPRRKCHCLRQRELDVLYEQSHLREMLATQNFEALSYDYYEGEDLERFRGAVKICRDFTENFKRDYANLFFYGTVGVGKSFLSGCVAGELLRQGVSVIYFSASALFDTLADYAFRSKEHEGLTAFCEDLYGCGLLIVDDLGTELTNAFVASQLFTCLNERHLRQHATIISTNLNLEELRDRYSDRVFSRITSHYTLCKLTGPDVRMKRRLENHNKQL